MRFSILLWALGLSALAMPALAQDTAPPPDTSEKCRAVPDENGNPQQPSDQQLEDCRGVLTPPPTGDTDMTAPPPEGGKTPVITPPEVPEQQPSQ